MNLSGISLMANNQTMNKRTESRSTQDDNSDSAGWKYVTVQEGNTVYTYIVIGKNMKVLIGKSLVQEDKDKDKKTADDKKETADNTDNANATGQNASNKMPDEQISFLTDYRMLGLTGYYQQKMREIMRNMEDHIACDEVDQVNTKTKDKHKTAESGI